MNTHYVFKKLVAMLSASMLFAAGLGLATATPAAAMAPVGFSASSLQNAGVQKPTAMQFGPDDRLYVLELDGDIKVLTIARNGVDDYTVTASETIDLVKNLPNHDDDGTLNAAVSDRLATGIKVAGTAANPVIYVASSDPRIGGGSTGEDLNLDTNSGIISRLTWNGASWDHLELVRGLPRSEENHSANGMEIDTATNTLYVAQGGNTNLGAPSNNFAELPEYALSAAVLSVDLDAIGSTTYDIPTLASTTLPWGGQSGDNQAMIVPGGPVQVHAPGYRNPYDVVLTQSGQLYTVDNGSNSGWGDVPQNEGPAGNCTNAIQEPGFTEDDQLHNITVAGTYGGHPNVLRGNPTATPWAAAVPAANPIECDQQPVSGNFDGHMTTFPVSTNGLGEYTADNFGGEMIGDLIAVGLNPPAVYRLELSPDGQSVTSNTTLFSNLNGRHLGLDVIGDTGPFPGTIWVTEFTNNGIAVFEPNDYDGNTGNCTGANDPLLDEDGDGFDNADEILNSTDPCSGADVPPDNDGDFESDLVDPDDDNDGVNDDVDPFAVDASNGTATSLPVVLEWENNSPPAGGILELGFTGLRTNGTDYLDLFDPFAMTIGGAAGVITIDAAPAGTAEGAANTGEYGFQLGVTEQVNPFESLVRVAAPFAGVTPSAGQYLGASMGNGTQDDYLRLVATANGIELGVEIGGNFTPIATSSTPMPGPDALDLMFLVDPVAATVQASYVLINGGVPGPRIDVGAPQAVPSAWLTGSTAFGVTSSRGAGTTFPVTFDQLEVRPVSTGGNDVAASMQITPTGNLNGSSSSAGSFIVENLSLTDDITSISLDLGSAIMPDMVYDPIGVAGDTNGSDVTIDLDPGIGYLGRTFAAPANGVDGANGWRVLTLDFNDFGPGELMTFSVDVDPNSIQGSVRPSPNNAGKVSGLELSGSTLMVDFSDGSTLTNEIHPIAGTSGGGETLVDSDRAAAPSIEMLGITGNPTSVVAAAQTIRITGPAGETVRLLHAESGLFFDPPGYDLDAYETNVFLGVNHLSGTIGGQGYVDIPVTLLDSEPAGGFNLFLATVESADGEPGRVSNHLTVELDPAGGGNVPPLIAPIGGQSVFEGQNLTFNVTATDDNGDPIALTASNVPGFGTFLDNGDNSGTFTFDPLVGDAGSYLNITVTADDGNGGIDNETFTLNVTQDGPPPSGILYRVNAGGAAISAIDGGPDWDIDTKTNPSPLHNTGSKTASFPVGMNPDGSVPASTPVGVWQTERKDPLALPEMEWEFPVTAGETVEVRLYIGNNSTGTTGIGDRKFDVSIDGNLVLDDYDIIADVGHLVGTMKSYTIVSDGIVDVDFGNVKNRPIVNAIEILGDPGPVVISPGIWGVWEGDTGSVFVDVPVTLDAPAADPVTVDWVTVDFPANPTIALSGEDYVAASGTVTFLPGETEQFVQIEVLGDTIDEPPTLYGQWVVISFTNPSANATVNQAFFGLGIATILDDD
ncbi:MAG: hypothetical protein HKN26_05370 [Acidimicrobiales bacterium]|nr:hypothetical protein [Acidimicrobiales bacterium]